MTHRILVVEPDSHHRLIVEVMIKRAGFEVLACSSGGEALARMGKFDVDLVIAEIDLDGMTGLELCQNIKSNANWADIPFIFLTRRKNLHERVRAIQLGVENFLVKPVYVRELISRVQMLMREQEVSSVTKKQLRDQYEGRLSEALLIDIIRSLENRSATGAIELYRENRSGTIWLEEGRVVDALTGSLLGKEAVYRLLLWRTGKFLIRFFPVSRPARIHKTNEELIYEGLRRLDEWNNITATLPGLDGVNLLDILEYAEGNEIPAGVDKLLDFLTPQTTTMDIAPKAAQKPKTSPAEALNILASHTVEMLAPIDSESANIPMDSGNQAADSDDDEHIETFVSTEQPDSTNLYISDDANREAYDDSKISVPAQPSDELDHVSSVVDFLNRPLEEVGSLWAQEAQKDFDLADILPSSEEIKNLRERIGGMSESIKPPDQQSVAHFAAKVDSSLSDEEETILNTLTNKEAEQYNQPWEQKLEEILETSPDMHSGEFRTPEELEEWNVLSPKIRREREITGNPIRPEGMSDVFEPSFIQQVKKDNDMSPSGDITEEDQSIPAALYSAPTVLLQAISDTLTGEGAAAPASEATTDTKNTDTYAPVESNVPAESGGNEVSEASEAAEPEPADDIHDIDDDDVQDILPEPPAIEAPVQPPAIDAQSLEADPVSEPPVDQIQEVPEHTEELPEPPVMAMTEKPDPIEPQVEPAPTEEPSAEVAMQPPADEEPPVEQEATGADQQQTQLPPSSDNEKPLPAEETTAPVVTAVTETPVAAIPAPQEEELDPLLAPAPPAPESDSTEEDYFGEPHSNWPKFAAIAVAVIVVVAVLGYSQLSDETTTSDSQTNTKQTITNTSPAKPSAALPDFDLNDPQQKAVPAEDTQAGNANTEADAQAQDEIPVPEPVAIVPPPAPIADPPKPVQETKTAVVKTETAPKPEKPASAPKPKAPAVAQKRETKTDKPAPVKEEPEAPATSITALINKGKALLSARKFAEAESVLREAAAAAPGSAVPYYWLAEIDIKKGDMKAAREQLLTATKKQKSYAPAWKRLGYVNEYLGDLPKAKEAYKTFLKYSPKGKDARAVQSILKEL